MPHCTHQLSHSFVTRFLILVLGFFNLVRLSVHRNCNLMSFYIFMAECWPVLRVLSIGDVSFHCTVNGQIPHLVNIENSSECTAVCKEKLEVRRIENRAHIKNENNFFAPSSRAQKNKYVLHSQCVYVFIFIWIKWLVTSTQTKNKHNKLWGIYDNRATCNRHGMHLIRLDLKPVWPDTLWTDATKKVKALCTIPPPLVSSLLVFSWKPTSCLKIKKLRYSTYQTCVNSNNIFYYIMYSMTRKLCFDLKPNVWKST